jgi:hypothetical protein
MSVPDAYLTIFSAFVAEAFAIILPETDQKTLTSIFQKINTELLCNPDFCKYIPSTDEMIVE